MTVSTLRSCVVCGTFDLTRSPEGLTCGDSLCVGKLPDTVRSLQEKANLVETLEKKVIVFEEIKRDLQREVRDLQREVKESVEIARRRLIEGLETLKITEDYEV